MSITVVACTATPANPSACHVYTANRISDVSILHNQVYLTWPAIDRQDEIDPVVFERMPLPHGDPA